MSNAMVETGAPAQAIAALDPELYLAPALSVQEAINRFEQFQELVSRLLVPARVYVDENGREQVEMNGADYGVLPGTKTRMLFQPGAEKLALFFGLDVTLHCLDKIEDWEHGFFKYTFRATVKRGGREIVNVDRTCHTREKKYAWVWLEAPKPSDREAEEKKALGLGRMSKVWRDRKPVWVWQEPRPNPDPWSLQFVVEAMAQKRAYVGAVKKALAATGFFAAEFDLEDFSADAESENGSGQAAAHNARVTKAARNGAQPEELTEIDRLLIAHWSKVKKSDTAGKAYFDAVYKSKTQDARRADALKLGLLTPSLPSSANVSQEPLHSLLEMLEALKDEQGIEESVLLDKIAELCDGESDVMALSKGDIDGLIAEFSKWLNAE